MTSPSLREDEKQMRVALAEARKGLGRTSPNPAVGAVVVKGKKVLARGHHRAAGLPHAEIEALEAIGSGASAEGATLYVTLEPCSTHGRTPPCVDRIRASGLKRVVIGSIDPNPAHSGRGLERLREAGIAVQAGVLEKECRELNEAFNKWIVTKMPFVLAKTGMSLDGRITRPSGEGQWITSDESRRETHRLRSLVDAILIGGETLRADNPRLTVRGISGATQPWRVVLTRTGNLPDDAHLFTDEHSERTLVYKGEPLEAVLRDLGSKNITSVLIEGGGELLGEAFDRRLVDKVAFFVAPLLPGGPKVAVAGSGVDSNETAVRLTRMAYQRFSDDVCVLGYPEYP